MERALYFLDERFWNLPALVVLFLVTIFVIVLMRYLIAAYAYQWAIFRWLEMKPIPGNHPNGKTQQKREIRWSISSSFIFAFLVAGCYWAYQKGITRIYIDFSAHSAGYFVLSIVIVLVLYETYYYWLHRWMHKPGVFRIIHKVHHDSIHTSVFTSFSFHPLEAFLQFIFLPIIIFTIPVHYAALGIVLMIMTVSAVINHAGAEVFPRGFHQHPLGKWMIGATHHDIHHKQFRTNFGLYFTFWDKWMKTESDAYEKEFKRNTNDYR